MESVAGDSKQFSFQPRGEEFFHLTYGFDSFYPSDDCTVRRDLSVTHFVTAIGALHSVSSSPLDDMIITRGHMTVNNVRMIFYEQTVNLFFTPD